MKKKFSQYKYQIILFSIITFICLFIFLPYILGETEFVLGWDMRSLYSSNFENLRTMLQTTLKTGELPFFSWSNFLGNDFYSSKLFYFQDIFDYPFAMFTNWSFYKVIIIQTYLKFLVAGFSFYAYARYHKYSPKTSIIGSLIFGFSAYGLQTMMHPFFGSFFVFLPLYFLTVDRYIVDNKKLSFIVIVMFMFINNYYLFYSVSLFTVLYFIFQYYMHHKTYKGFFINALPLIGCYFVGFMLSGVVVVPEVLAILGNQRVGKSSSFLIYNSLLPYLDYLSGIFTPTSILANRNTAITPIYSYVSVNDSVMAVFLWASSATSLLLPQLFTKKNKKNIYIISALIISAVALIPILSSAMHGFSEPSFRWLQSPLFLMIISILPFIEDFSLIDKKIFKNTVIGLLILLILTTPFIATLTGYNFIAMLSDYSLILLYIPTLLLIAYAIIKENKKLLIVFLMIELSMTSYLSFIVSPYFSEFSKDTMNKVHHVLLNKDDYNDYLYQIDPINEHSFYRSYVDPSSVYWDMSLNLNLDFNIMGLLSYDSTYLSSTNDLKKLSPIEAYLPWTFDIQNSDIMNLVSTKYAIVTNENQVPFTNFKKVGEFNYLLIYENLDFINLGKTYTNLITYDQYNGDTSILNDTLVVHSEDENTIRSLLGNEVVVFESVSKTMNTVTAEINTNQDGFALLSVPYDKGWKVVVNSIETEAFSVSGGFIGIPLNSGLNTVQLYFIPYGLKIGFTLSIIGGVCLIVMIILAKKNRKTKKIKN